MRAQIVIHLSGPAAELLVRGAQDRATVMAHADTDRQRARCVGDALQRLTGEPYDEQAYLERTWDLLLGLNWHKVRAVAAVLAHRQRVEGEHVMRIIDRS